MKVSTKAVDYMVDLTTMSIDELHQLAKDAKDLCDSAWAEIGRWEVVRCTVCDVDDLSYRGEPFITWSNPSGYPLCPKCSFRFKNGLPKRLTITPKEEVLALLD